ncbi:hypothetical protein N7541_007452 [Penicillium brevicompactum]|uniref:Transcription factor TFIIIC triple barrel domain-containing protein n=1 Tax=Penicillium brevicompactum TaxID=5074 RepID=A0A9W9QYL3_PENBR|nr:hypothetical protein N7541_007452 [Penicillium brevicompactum]
MATSDQDEEYEYEYGSETETFYLNLDLTSHHGAVRPPRRRKDHAANDTQAPLDTHHSRHPSEASNPMETTERGSFSNERIQVLGLHTCNPIVSYQNHMFSCSWADQIGTELVFSSPNTADDPANLPEPLHRGPSFELVAANSVKILGRKAHITSSFGSTVPQHTEAGTPTTNLESGATSQEPTQGSVPRRPIAPSHQAQFLSRLQDLKESRGEPDTVRTVVSGRRPLNMDNVSNLQGWVRTETQLAEIRRLNERASRGDVEAQMALEMMISGFQTGSEYEYDSGSDNFTF